MALSFALLILQRKSELGDLAIQLLDLVVLQLLSCLINFRSCILERSFLNREVRLALGQFSLNSLQVALELLDLTLQVLDFNLVVLPRLLQVLLHDLLLRFLRAPFRLKFLSQLLDSRLVAFDAFLQRSVFLHRDRQLVLQRRARFVLLQHGLLLSSEVVSCAALEALESLVERVAEALDHLVLLHDDVLQIVHVLLQVCYGLHAHHRRLAHHR